MRFRILFGALAALGFADVAGAQEKSWIAYCEGNVDGRNVAYVSSDIWRHQDGIRYREKVGEMAMELLSTADGPPLYGCSGVPFSTDSLAEESQRRVVEAHALTGTPVDFFEIPVEMAADLRTRVQKIADLGRTRVSGAVQDEASLTLAPRLPD